MFYPILSPCSLVDLFMLTRPGKPTVCELKIAIIITIVDLPINSMVDLSIVM